MTAAFDIGFVAPSRAFGLSKLLPSSAMSSLAASCELAHLPPRRRLTGSSTRTVSAKIRDRCDWAKNGPG